MMDKRQTGKKAKPTKNAKDRQTKRQWDKETDGQKTERKKQTDYRKKDRKKKKKQ